MGGICIIYTSQEQLKKSWERFVNEGIADRESVGEIILESWQRCQKYMVDPIKSRPITVYQGAELKTHQSKYTKLIDVSLPVMKNLYSFVGDGNFVIVLADEQGCILEMFGDETVKSSAIAGDFVPGVNWSEKAIGNNGVGTALFLDKPVQILGREHYWREAHH